MTLRKHQQQFRDEIANVPDDGDSYKEILVHATPGAGKSALPVIATDLIKRGLADRICWVVPRDSLRTQGEQNFLDPFFRKMLGHNCMIRAASNESDPCRGTRGFATTYQAISCDSQGTVFSEFCTHRYILVLDEFHHLERDGLWMQKIQQIYSRAAYVVLMTGTMERGDGKPIGIMPYKKGFANGKRCLVPDMEHEDVAYIHYSRADALRERAIIPMLFYLTDGSAEWSMKNGGKYKVDSFAAAAPEDTSAAIYTALRTDFARDLIERSVAHWLKWRKRIKTAKLLVVTADIHTAQDALQQVRKLTNRPAAIATSHETAEARKSIAAFKAGRVEILVSIAMAYEGLDVPEISHICCLSHIRSTPWIEQMIARAVRIDKAYQYEGQCAHIYAPDDPRFREIVNRIEAEQMATASMPRGAGGNGEEQLTLKMPEGFEAESNIIPIGSRAAETREHLYGRPAVSEEALAPVPAMVTPRERESILRREIEIHIRKYCHMNRVDNKRVNAEIKEHFGKARGDMTGPELGVVLDFVRNNYPAYQARGVRPRVSRGIDVING